MNLLPVSSLARSAIIERDAPKVRDQKQLAAQLRPGQSCLAVKSISGTNFCLNHDHGLFPDRCPDCPPEPRRVTLERRTPTGILVMTDGTRFGAKGYRCGENGRRGWRTILSDVPTEDPYDTCDGCHERKRLWTTFRQRTCHACFVAASWREAGADMCSDCNLPKRICECHPMER